jgi:hypothetical protein
MKRIRAIWRTAARPFNRLWEWATGHPRRWKKLAEWTDKKRRYARSKHRLERAKFWAAKRTVYREKWQKAKERLETHGQAVYEPWMANGHEGYNLTSRAKELLVVAVIRYGLTCTSITRSWGTGSFHERIPTQGFDCAGARMVEFQRDLRAGRIGGYSIGDLLELFGPDNAACADNGAPYSMSEGSGIETLHDTHVHVFVY